MIEAEIPRHPDPCSRRFLFLLASTRRNGNSEWLARRAAASLPQDCLRWLRLTDLQLSGHRDLREEQPTTPWPEADTARLLLETLAADDLALVSPLYWYGPTTVLKHYLDHWSAWLRLECVDFRAAMHGKRLWLVCVLGDQDITRAEPLVAMLRSTASYMGMAFAGALIGRGSRRGEVRSDRRALAKARRFFDPQEVSAAVATLAKNTEHVL
jgi:putative NADPH-quinone reductase